VEEATTSVESNGLVAVLAGSSSESSSDMWQKKWTFNLPRAVAAKLEYGPHVNALELTDTGLPSYEKPCSVRVDVKFENPTPLQTGKYTVSLNLEQQPANGDPPSVGSVKAIDAVGASGLYESVVSVDVPRGPIKLPASIVLCRVKGPNGTQTDVKLTLEALPVKSG
jgi:hypothetical protein